MLRFKRNVLVVVIIVSIIISNFVNYIPVMAEEINGPYFINVEEINNRVENNSWAAAVKNDLLSKANLWLERTPFFYERSTDYGYRGAMVCPVENSALKYEYHSSVPTSITCPGADCVYDTSDDHVLDSTSDGWTAIEKAWAVMWLCDHLDAAQTLGLAYQLADSTDVNKEKYGQKSAEILREFAEVYADYELHDVNGYYGDDTNMHHQRGKAMVTWLDEAHYVAIPAAWAYDFLYDSGYLSVADKQNIELMLTSAISDVIIPGTISGRGGTGTTGTNNWYSYAYAAAMAVGCRLNIDDYKSYALSGLKYQMNNRVESDGFWWEGTLGYHNMVLNAYFYLCESAYTRGLDVHLDLYNEHANLKNMYYAVCNAAFPDDLNVQMNNEGGGNSSLYSYGTAINLEVASAVFDDPQFDKYLNQIGTKAPRSNYLNDATNFQTGGFLAAVPLLIGTDITNESDITYVAEADYEGLGSLRTITADESGDKLFVSLDHGVDGASHAHFDKLNLVMSAKGQIIGKDLGTCSYGSPLKTEYYKNTIAHNTITVNETSQVAVKGHTEALRTTKRMAVLGASAVESYSTDLSEYNRTLISIAPYVIDIFRVAGNVDGTPYTYDWSFQNVDSTLSIEGVSLSEQNGNLGSDNGYQHINKVAGGTVDSQYSALFTINNHDDLGHKITFLPSAQMEVYNTIAPGEGKTPSVKIPKLVVRANATGKEEMEFVAVHETIEGESKIQSIEKEDGVIKITKTSGDIEYVSYDIKQENYNYIALSNLGVIKNLDTMGSNSIELGNRNYLTTTEKPEYFSAEIDGKTLKIEHAPYDLGSVSLYLGNADVERVVVNGYAIEYSVTEGNLTYECVSLPHIAKAWDFSENTENWNGNRSVADFTHKVGGYIRGTVLQEAMITSDEDLDVSITNDKVIRIKLRNDTSATTGKLYFMTEDDTSWSDRKSVEFSIKPHDTSYTEYIIDMTNIPQWTGMLKQLRIDPADKVKGGFFAIDHVWIAEKVTDGSSVSDSLIIQVTPANILFENCDEGNSSEEVKTITIKNIGSDNVITLKQPVATNYTVGNLSKTQLAKDETASFTIIPKVGLEQGVYSEVIEVSTTDGEAVSVAVSFTVNHVHSWGTAWYSSRTHHWKECEKPECNLTENADKDSYGRHQYLDDSDVTCETCQYIRKIYSDDQPVVIKAWDFDTDIEGWSAKNINGLSYEEGGYIGGTMATGDPRLISSSNLEVAITDYPLLVIKMKNSTPSDFGTVYYATNENPGFNEEKSIVFAIKPNDDIYREYVIDLSEDINWTGTLQQLRLDPNSGTTEGSFSIDSIYIAYTEEDITLDKESLEFDELEEGYTSADVKTVTITNTGSQTIIIEQPTAENYEVGALSSNILAVRETATFSVIPKQGLDAGIYSEEIIVKTTNDTSATVDLKVIVKSNVDTIVAKAWDFDADTEGWTHRNNRVNEFAWASGGYIGGTISHSDPYIISPDNLEGIDISSTPLIVLKMKNGTQGTTGSIYFSTKTSSAFDETKKVNFELVQDDMGYTEYVIDMSDIAEWTGELKQLRLDTSNGVNVGSFSIDYIYIANQTRSEEISLDSTSSVFNSLEVGYVIPEIRTVTITNVGSKKVILEQPTAVNYEVGTLSTTELPVGSTSSFTITPKTGLEIGTYVEDIIVKTSDNTVAKTSVSFNVIDHSWREEWNSNDTYHWHECDNESCNITEHSQKDGYDKHNYTNEQDITCDTCDYSKTLIVAKEWNFNTGAEGWVAPKHISDLTVENGYISGSIIQGDPQLKNYDLNIDISKTPYIFLKMKNGTSATNGTLVFSTDKATNIVIENIGPIIANDTEYTEYVIDMSNVPEWTDTLNYLRLDPIDGAIGTFSIDYIYIANMKIGTENSEVASDEVGDDIANVN